MKMKFTHIFSALILSLTMGNLAAQASDDNEIMIEQVGDTLKLYIDQIGYGNKIGLNDYSSGSGSDMIITGSSLELDLDFTGNENLLYGPLIADSTYIKIDVTGDSTDFDWNIGYIGSADSSNLNFDITGDSNQFDLDQGYVTSAERLNLDLILLGDSNIFDIDFESDDATWDFDITGDSNNINTLQTDGSDHIMKVIHVGDSGDFDIVQSSGTCPQGINSCIGKIDLDIDSENAIVTINQKDSSD